MRSVHEWFTLRWVGHVAGSIVIIAWSGCTPAGQTEGGHHAAEAATEGGNQAAASASGEGCTYRAPARELTGAEAFIATWVPGGSLVLVSGDSAPPEYDIPSGTCFYAYETNRNNPDRDDVVKYFC